MITTKISRSAQLISGSALLAIAIAAGATGLWINVHHGLTIRPEAGILFGLADLTRIALPIVCGLTAWTLQCRLVAMVCVATSLFCAVTAFNLGADQKLAGKQHGAEQYAAQKLQVQSLEAQVASLDAQAAQEAKQGGCGKQCKYLGERADKARQELGSARETLAAARPVEVASYERLNARISSVLFLVLIESLVWMAVPAMTLLAAARRKPEVKAVIRKSRKTAAKPKRKTDAQVAMLKQIANAPKLTKSGNLDQRTKAARAVKRVTSRQLLTA